MLSGPLSEPLKGWAFFGGLSVNQPGYYELEIGDGVLAPDTVDFDAYMHGSGGGPGGSFDLCDTANGGPGCQSGGGNDIGTSEPDSVFVNDPFDIFAGVIDSLTGRIDTSYSGTMSITFIQGPGNLFGPMNLPFNGYTLFGGLTVDQPGHYQLVFSDGFLPPDTVDFDAYMHGSGGSGGFPGDPCDTAAGGAGCQSGGGNLISSTVLDSIFVNDPFDLVAGVLDSLTGRFDTSYAGTMSITLIQGPGFLSGVLNGPFQGLVFFHGLTVDQPGHYTVAIGDGFLPADTLHFEAHTHGSGGGPGGSGGPCDTANGGPGCQAGGGNLIGTSEPDSVFVNDPFDLFAGVIDSLTGRIDTTYVGTMSITFIQGPGNLIGPMSAPLKGFAAFYGLTVDQPGYYELAFGDGVLPSDTMSFDAYMHGPGGGPGGLGDPCDTAFGPGCQAGGGNAIAFSEPEDSVFVNDPFDLIAGVIDSLTGRIDTTYAGMMSITVVQGPGNLFGPTSSPFNGFTFFIGLSVNQPGHYELAFSDGVLPPDTLEFEAYAHGSGGGGGDPCDTANGGLGCQSGGGDVIGTSELDTVMINQPFDFFAGVIDTLTGRIDTSYTGTMTINQLSGPGVLSGSLSEPIQKWAYFPNLVVNAVGIYELSVSDGILPPETLSFYADSLMGPGGPGGPCNNATVGARENLGLYGGASLDLSFSTTTGRLFAAISTPASLFASDDTANTWYACFPADSLEYDCNRGWGGRALRVLTNNVGWVAVQTSQEAGTLTSSIVSFSDGDTGTWRTAMDGALLQSYGLAHQSVNGIALSDYWMYVLNRNYITRLNNTKPFDPFTDILDIRSMPGMHPDATARSIAVANNSMGFPYYITVDTTNSFQGGNAGLYKVGPGGIAALALPSGVVHVSSVYTHPLHSGGDTLFINARDMTNNLEMYRSLDGGMSWTNITPPGFVNWEISDADYSPDWQPVMPQSDGLALMIPGSHVSYDMGTSWVTFQLPNNGGAIHPRDTSWVVGTRGRGVSVSATGIKGPYAVARNFGLEAVQIKQIAHTEGRNLYYIATKAGLAYTTAYLDSTVSNFDKWNPPHGEFPVPNVGDDSGITSVAINPWDSLNVIAGYSNGFAVTTTGPSGFGNVNPPNWQSTPQANPHVRDIAFVTNTIVLAVTGGENMSHSGSGNIWRSVDGGANWITVTPGASTFSNGNAIAVGYSNTDTVIYIGTGLDQSMNTIDQGVLWESVDLGLTWSKVNDGPNSINGPVMNMPIYDVAVDPRSTDTLYLASGSNLDHAFVRSEDGGLTYDYTMITGEGAFTSVAIDPDDPDLVYTAIRRDIYQYNAATDSITHILRGLPGELVPDLAFGSVIAGTNTGLFSLELPEPPDHTGLEELLTDRGHRLLVYPNPASHEAIVRIELKERSLVSAVVFDLYGREMAVLAQKEYMNDTNELRFDSNSVPEGSYFVRIAIDDVVRVIKLTVLR